MQKQLRGGTQQGSRARVTIGERRKKKKKEKKEKRRLRKADSGTAAKSTGGLQRGSAGGTAAELHESVRPAKNGFQSFSASPTKKKVHYWAKLNVLKMEYRIFLSREREKKEKKQH